MTATTKIVWGFVEKSSVRVAGYSVSIRKDGHAISATTSASGFYQLNLGNLHAAFSDGDQIYAEALGDTNFSGEAFVVLSGGTATQQIPTIAVAEDNAAPVLELAPGNFLNSPKFIFQYKDSHSGPAPATIRINGTAIVANGSLVEPGYSLEIVEISRKQRKLLLDYTGSFAEGQHIELEGEFGDYAGNVNNFSETVVFDFTSPEIIHVHPADKEIISNTLEPLVIRVRDVLAGVNAGSISLSIDGVIQPITFDGEYIKFTPMGPYLDTSSVHWALSVSDNASNRTETSGCFIVFSVRPEIADISPQSFTNNRRSPIKFSVTPGSSPIDWTTLTIQVNTLALSSSDVRISIAGNVVSFLPDFDLDNAVRVVANVYDTEGLSAAASWTFIVDTSVPVIVPIMPTPGTYVKSPLSILSFTVTEPDTFLDRDSVFVTVNGDRFDVASGRLSITNSQILYVPQIHYFRNDVNQVFVQAKDIAGNEAAPLDLAFYVDDESPAVLSVSPQNTTNNLQPTIEIKIEDEKSGIYAPSISVTINGRQYTPADPELSFDGLTITVFAQTFAPNEEVEVRLYVKDIAGNVLDRVVSVFTFDLSPFSVLSSVPESNSYKAIRPDQWEIYFNKPVDLSNAAFGTDILLESRDATNNLSIFLPEPIDGASGIDLFDGTRMNVIPEMLFQPNREYRLNITNRVQDLAGNLLGGDNPIGDVVFSTKFAFYQAGDTLIRGRIGVADILKYSKIINCCNHSVVTPLPELVDLTGDGLVDNKEILLLEAIVLEEKTTDHISVNGTTPITSFPIPVLDGEVQSIQLTGFPDKQTLDKTTGILCINGSLVAAIQLDISYDSNILSLIDIQPLVPLDIFRYRLLEPGKIRLLAIESGGTISGDAASLSFRVIGAGVTPIEIDALSIEAVSITEAILTPVTIIDALFATSPGAGFISSIQLEPDTATVPIGSREVFVTARLIDSSNVQIFAESVPIEWTVIGNGFVLQNITYTDETGESRNLVHLSGPVNSSVIITATVLFDSSISNESTPIRLFDDQIISLRLTSDKAFAGTGEAVQFRAFAMTLDEREFETTAVTWEVEGENAIVSTSGEFVAFSSGDYRIRATLNEDGNITALSSIISVTSVLEFYDCHDRPIGIDSMTGFPKLSLGAIFAGKTTGTQEVRVRNALAASAQRMHKDIILDLSKEPSRANLRTEFYPVIASTLSLKKRNVNGILQEIPLQNGHQDEFVIRALRMSDRGVDGLVVIYLNHVNVYDVSVFHCGPNICIGKKSRNILWTQKDSPAELTKDGDFFIDNPTGRILVKITSDADYPGKLCYRYRQSATVEYRPGKITLDESVLLPDNAVLAAYSFISGTIENLAITVDDAAGSEVYVSSDGVNFSKSLTIEFLPASEMFKLYIRAEAPITDELGIQSAGISIEADILSVTAC